MKQESKSKSPIEMFFKLGDKVTGGDPKRLLDWNYSMLWIMFIAFLTILIGNLIEFYKFQKLANLGWSFVMLAIIWFQYQGLKATYEQRKLFKKLQGEPKEQLETEKDMLNEFNELKGGQETQMKKCDNCGKEISEDRDICGECIKKTLKRKKCQ